LSGPLTGLRVLDLTRVLAGPWCTQILGDLGADIIKIERPRVGDDTRHWGPPWFLRPSDGELGESSYFLSANRSKHSVTVDLANDEGRDLIRQLAAQSDVLVENFKTGDLARKGLGYEQLRASNPRLIYCSITGFGATGPQAGQAGYDYLVQAQGGLMSLTGWADGAPGAGPMRSGMAVSDLTTGMNAAIAILAALHHRTHSGEGQWIDLALLDVQVSWLANQAQGYFATGVAPARTGDQHPSLVPYQPFHAKDGLLIVAVGNDGQFQRFCAVLEREQWAQEPQFATNYARVTNREQLIPMLAARVATFGAADLQERLRAVGVPCGPVQSLDQVFADPQVLARHMIVETPHRRLGHIKTVANPAKYSATPLSYEKGPPTLGEDTATVLSERLGLSPEAIEGLRRRGVI
jgi:crotonobetainyl-CoA:carnitine CoA-transferase CaiB-like acyl-CoA transferase